MKNVTQSAFTKKIRMEESGSLKNLAKNKDFWKKKQRTHLNEVTKSLENMTWFQVCRPWVFFRFERVGKSNLILLYSLVHRDSPQWDTVILITNGVSGIIKISPNEHKLPFFPWIQKQKNKLIQQEFRIKMQLSFFVSIKRQPFKRKKCQRHTVDGRNPTPVGSLHPFTPHFLHF